MTLKPRLKGKQEVTDISPAQTPGTFQGLEVILYKLLYVSLLPRQDNPVRVMICQKKFTSLATST